MTQNVRTTESLLCNGTHRLVGLGNLSRKNLEAIPDLLNPVQQIKDSQGSMHKTEKAPHRQSSLFFSPKSFSIQIVLQDDYV